jgi:hypothetical protein
MGTERSRKDNKLYRERHPELVSERKKASYCKRKEKYQEAKKKYNQTLNGRMVMYKSSAKDKGLLFNLTKEEFLSFWQQSCFYCGAEIATIGLDRVDNTRGYELDNIVSCCSWCNYLKRDKSFDEFMDFLFRVANRWK